VNIESGQEKEQYKIVRGNITLKEKQGKADLAKNTPLGFSLRIAKH
jgi:hypothetical protein